MWPALAFSRLIPCDLAAPLQLPGRSDAFITRASIYHSMATDTVTPSGHGAPEVMASIDGEGERSRLVIADVTADGTWLSVSAEAAATLTEWC